MEKRKGKWKDKATKETILEEQARLKKEPFMLDDVKNWTYIVKEEPTVEKFKKGNFYHKSCSKKHSK